MSSITDAITKLRPDLNKQTKFQRGPETKLAVPPAPVAHGLRSGGVLGSGSSSRKFSLPALDEATTRLSADDLRLQPAEAASDAMRGWFGLAWLATTRSRVLATTLAAVCAGIAVGFYPMVGDVSGRSQNEPVEIAPSADEAIASAADAEATAVVQKAVETASAAPAAIQVSESAKPEAGSPASSAPAAPVAATEPAAPKVALMPIRSTAAATATGSVQPTLIVRSPGKNLDAAAAPAISAPMVASAASPAAPVFGQDEPLPPAPKTYPQVEEVLYEAIPADGAAIAKPIGSDDAKPAKAAAAPKQDAAPAKPSSGITLSGIFWDEKTPMAMINGEIVEVGASIGGAKVVKINPETVILQQDGQQKTLAL